MAQDEVRDVVRDQMVVCKVPACFATGHVFDRHFTGVLNVKLEAAFAHPAC